jgi:hypothetical protein
MLNSISTIIHPIMEENLDYVPSPNQDEDFLKSPSKYNLSTIDDPSSQYEDEGSDEDKEEKFIEGKSPKRVGKNPHKQKREVIAKKDKEDYCGPDIT